MQLLIQYGADILQTHEGKNIAEAAGSRFLENKFNEMIAVEKVKIAKNKITLNPGVGIEL